MIAHTRHLTRPIIAPAALLAITSSLAASPSAHLDAPRQPPTPAALTATAAPLPALSKPADLITTQRGTLPIIISAPHGGSVRVPGSTGREGGVQVRDVNTAEIALLISQRLTEKLGAKPSFVIAQFSRKDADANRDRPEAADNDAARAQYDAYHAALRTLVDEARAASATPPQPPAANPTTTPAPKPLPRAILLDLHGQSRAPEAIVRGTRNGQTVRALLSRSGAPALTGPSSIFGYLKDHGYTIIPDAANPAANVEPNADGAPPNAPSNKPSDKPADKPAPTSPPTPPADAPAAAHGRETFFDGGFIVAHYGSHNDDGIDAIQIEIGAQRSNNTLKVARDIADAIVAYYNQFIEAP